MSTSVGDNCIDRAQYSASTITLIDPKDIIPFNCKVNSWCIFSGLAGSGSAKLKVFRDDGANWIFVGESNLLAIANGLNTNLSVNISAKAGDILGLYLTNTIFLPKLNGATNIPFINGTDVTTTRPKTDYDTAGRNYDFISFQAQVDIIVSGEAKKEFLGNISKLGYAKRGAFINRPGGKGASFS